MRPLADPDFNPALPLQTLLGTRQALRVGKTKVLDLVGSRQLDVVDIDGSTRITTESINRLINERRRARKAGAQVSETAA